MARVSDGAQEVDSLALYNGQRTLLLDGAEVAGREHHRRGRRPEEDAAETAADHAVAARRAGSKSITDSSRPIRVSVENVRRTLIEGALLTVLIVFLFLHSWRSTVITGLTLPIAVIGTFLFMDAFGFTLNLVTLMALSLCIGLLIDDAIVVRENIVRHVADGQDALITAALDGTAGDRPGGDGDHVRDRRRVPADRLHGRHHRQVLPPVRHHGRRRGADLAVRDSFTLDPMLSSIWHDPDVAWRTARPTQPDVMRQDHRPRAGWFDRWCNGCRRRYQVILRWSLAASAC